MIIFLYRYIILSENIGFIQPNILERCQVISMAKPKITKYKKMFNKNVKAKKIILQWITKKY